ncbi:hypothetical protein ACN47E_007744 [Coniothyrium glycines]
MHSLGGWFLVVGSVLGVTGAVLPTPTPAITPAPRPAEDVIRSLQQRQEPDAISLARVLLTALPLSLRIIAATDLPAVSSILWEEFLDNKKPQWFLNLPQYVQSYLIVEFGPETAWPTAAPTTDGIASQATTTVASQPSGMESISDTASTSDVLPTLSSSKSLPSNSISTPLAHSSLLSDLSSRQTSSTFASRSRTSNATAIPSSSASASTDPEAPPSSNSGMSRQQKIGIGVGVPLGLVGLAAILFTCCFLLRRRRRRQNYGTEPPTSPGFIPRFSFQDRTSGIEQHEYRAPLNTSYNHNHSSRFVEDTNWHDDEYEPAAIAASQRRDTFPPLAGPTAPAQPMAMHNSQPIIAPLLHTHSSRKARGKRTSYSSLHSVAEAIEPDDGIAESPVLGRHHLPPKTGPRRPSMPSVLEIPQTPYAGTIKRKPVATSPTASPAADAASRSLLRPGLTKTAAQHSGSSSSGIAISSNNSSNSGLGNKTESPISPGTDPTSLNPFSNDFAYLEDYGPEYSYDGYLDYEDGLYGGNRSLDRYPEPSSPRRTSTFSKTEWPLRNVLGSVKIKKSPMWERVYESP